MTLSSVVVAKPCVNTPSIPILRLLFPFQRAFHPLVDEADGEDGEEKHHGKKTRHADLVDHRGPGEEEGDLEVEQDEKDRHQVVAHVELHARVLEGLEAAFIRRELLRIGAARREQLPENQRRHADAKAHQDEKQNWKVFCEHSLVPTSRLELLRLFRPLAPQASVSTNFTTWAASL